MVFAAALWPASYRRSHGLNASRFDPQSGLRRGKKSSRSTAAAYCNSPGPTSYLSFSGDRPGCVHMQRADRRPDLESSHQTQRWRETDSNPRSPGYGELGAPGRATRPTLRRARRRERSAICGMPGAASHETKPSSRSASATSSIWRRPCSISARLGAALLARRRRRRFLPWRLLSAGRRMRRSTAGYVPYSSFVASLAPSTSAASLAQTSCG
jgi:hypothetical protein